MRLSWNPSGYERSKGPLGKRLMPVRAVVRSCYPCSMGLDVHNALFGNLHLNWTGTGTSWFCYWCWKHELPYPFIGWVNGDTFGDQCILGPDNPHSRLARAWCRALEEKQPEIAKLGGELIANHRMIDLYDYLYPNGQLGKGLE